MFGSVDRVFGLFSQDLALDLGTSNTRVWQRGIGVVREEPTVISVRTDRRGQRSILAIGETARGMLGRCPVDIEAIRPVKGGRIENYDVAEAFLVHLVRQLHGRNHFVRPRMTVAVAHDADEADLRAVRDSCGFAGAREIHLLPRPIAAALGAGLPVDEPSGCMVVDIGGGNSEVAVVCLQGVMAAQSIPGGGDGMDEAIMLHVAERHGLLIPKSAAESAKFALAGECDAGKTVTVKGRCLDSGLPRGVKIGAEEIRQALSGPIAMLAQAIVDVLEATPPEMAGDVIEQGVVLTGGGAQLRDLDQTLRELTGLPVVVADDPTRAVVKGAGKAMDRDDLLSAWAH